MGAWIISIVGVICLGILLEIVLPEGQTAKYVKGAFSLLIVFVIAAPLPNLLSKDWKLNLDSPQFNIDEDYINSTYALYAEGIKNDAERALILEGYDADVVIQTKKDSPLSVESVVVTVKNFKPSVLDSVTEDVKRILSERFKCDKSRILVGIDGR